MFISNDSMKYCDLLSLFFWQFLRCRGPYPPCNPGAGDQSVHWWTMEHGLVQNHRCPSHPLSRPTHAVKHTHTLVHSQQWVNSKVCKMMTGRSKNEAFSESIFPGKAFFQLHWYVHMQHYQYSVGQCPHKRTNDVTLMKRGQNTHTHSAKEEVFGPLMRDRLQQ